jgi:hypothetical protein
MFTTRRIGTFVILVLLILSITVPAFASDAGGQFSARLTGADEVPAVDTSAIGKVVFKVSRDGESIRYRLVAANINNPFAAHIHMGAPGVNGPVVVLLFSGPVASGPHNGLLSTGTITAANLTGPLAGQPLSALVDLLESGGAYVNVHTNDGIDPPNTGAGDMASGEIRGQLH